MYGVERCSRVGGASPARFVTRALLLLGAPAPSDELGTPWGTKFISQFLGRRGYAPLGSASSSALTVLAAVTRLRPSRLEAYSATSAASTSEEPSIESSG
jgi:hypothetical protein